MPEMQSDTTTEIQYHVLQNQAETHQACHDLVLFHWAEDKKHPEKKQSIRASRLTATTAPLQ